MNGFESSPYYPFGTSVAPKVTNLGTDFTSLPPGVNLNQESQRSNSQNNLLDGLENRRYIQANNIQFNIQMLTILFPFIDSAIHALLVILMMMLNSQIDVIN